MLGISEFSSAADFPPSGQFANVSFDASQLVSSPLYGFVNLWWTDFLVRKQWSLSKIKRMGFERIWCIPWVSRYVKEICAYTIAQSCVIKWSDTFSNLPSIAIVIVKCCFSLAHYLSWILARDKRRFWKQDRMHSFLPNVLIHWLCKRMPMFSLFLDPCIWDWSAFPRGTQYTRLTDVVMSKLNNS